MNKQERDKMILDNQSLVYGVVNKYFSNKSKPNYEDICQIGFLGLTKAVNNFDEKFGYKLSSYAYSRIKGDILNSYRDENFVHVDRETKQKLNQLTKIECEGYFNDDIIINNMQITKDELHNLRHIQKNKRWKSLDRNHDLTGNPLVETIDSEVKFTISEQLDVSEALKVLDEREEFVIRKRYFEDISQPKVGKLINLSQGQVSRIEKKALLKMKEALGGSYDFS